MSRVSQPPIRWSLVAVVVIGAAVAAAYFNSLTVPFLFDDKRSIPENPHVRQVFPLGVSMGAPPQTTVAGRPVVALSLALNYAVCGLEVRGYHVVNVLIHFACALLLFAVIRRCLIAMDGSAFTVASAGVIALAVALVWAVHPIQTMCVTYVIQRAESLMSLFLLLAVYASIRAIDSRWTWGLVAVVACLLSAGCKEVAVVIPVLLVVIDRVIFFPVFADQWRRRKWLYLGLATSWVLLLVLNRAGPRSESAGWGLGAITPWQYLLTQPEVLLHYVRLALWPYPLCLDYDWPIANEWMRITGFGALVVGLVVFTVRGIFARRPVALLPAMALLVLAPTSSVIPLLGIASEHRMYLPLAMVCLAVVLVGRRLLGGRKGFGFGAVAIVVATLSVLTHQRNETYQSAVSIWSDVVAQRPRNIRAQNNLGNELHRVGQNESAVRAYQAALEVDPARFDVLYNLGVAQLELQRLEDAASSFREAIRLNPRDGNVRAIFGHTLQVAGRAEEALPQLQEAVALLPGYGRARDELALTLQALGRTQEAVAVYESFAEALGRSGRVGEAAGMIEKAIGVCDAARDAAMVARLRKRLVDLQQGRR